MQKSPNTQDVKTLTQQPAHSTPSLPTQKSKKKLHVGKEIEAMRKQIRLLQEKRIEGLMSEMDELRRERDLERRKAKLLKRTVEGERIRISGCMTAGIVSTAHAPTSSVGSSY